MNFSIELSSSIFYFIGLVIIYNLREVILKYNKQSYNYISLGLGTLSFTSAFSHIFVKNSIPEISQFIDSKFFELIYWIGIISGVTSVASGTSTWLPIYKKEQVANKHNFKKAELFKQIEKLIRFENRNPIILLQTIELITKQYDFSEVSCFILSQKNKNFSFLGAYNQNESNNIQSHNIHFDYNTVVSSLENENLISSVITTDAKPKIVLPLTIENKILGLVCIYTETEVDRDSIINLKLVLEIISSKMYKDSLELQNNQYRETNKWNHTVKEILGNTTEITDTLRLTKSLLSEKFSVDFISITFPFNGYNPKYILAENNQVLENMTYKMLEPAELENYVSQHNMEVAINNLDKEIYFNADIIALQNNIKSIVSTPIELLNGTKAALTIASKQYDTFTKPHLALVQPIKQQLEAIITHQFNNLVDMHISSMNKRLHKIQNKAFTTQDTSSFYQEILELISKELETSFVRLSLFDDDKRFLKSQALIKSYNEIATTPQDATMMLALMPTHKRVVQTREIAYSYKSEMNLDAFMLEARQIFAESISQIVVAPVFCCSQMLGVLSLGFETSCTKLTEEHLRFLDSITYVLDAYFQFKSQFKSTKLNTVKTVENSQVVKNSINRMQDYEVDAYIKNLDTISQDSFTDRYKELIKG